MTASENSSLSCRRLLSLENLLYEIHSIAGKIYTQIDLSDRE
jgi:hypothetical protein